MLFRDTAIRNILELLRNQPEWDGVDLDLRELNETVMPVHRNLLKGIWGFLRNVCEKKAFFRQIFRNRACDVKCDTYRRFQKTLSFRNTQYHCKHMLKLNKNNHKQYTPEARGTLFEIDFRKIWSFKNSLCWKWPNNSFSNQ